MITTNEMLENGFKIIARSTDGGTNTFGSLHDIPLIITIYGTNPLTLENPNIKIQKLLPKIERINLKDISRSSKSLFVPLYEGECTSISKLIYILISLILNNDN